jgi:hypothetical protein
VKDVTHVFEALLKSDFLGGQSDARSLITLRQQAEGCIRLLRNKLGMSQEGALNAVHRVIKSEPLAMCDSPTEKMMMACLILQTVVHS